MEENKNQGKVVVIRENNNQKKSNWTWGRYGKSIIKFKYWNIGVTVALALAGFLGVRFIYNNKKSSFVSSFSYTLPLTMDNDTGNGTYSDGTAFNYLDLLSSETLKEVVNSNSDYSSIDVDNIVKNNSISITTNGYTDTDGKFNISLPITYTISGKLSAIGSQELAASFISDLASTVKTKAIAAVDNFKISDVIPTDSIFNSLDFEDQIELLSEEYDQIKNSLSNLTKTIDLDSSLIKVDSEGTTLESELSNFTLNYKKGAGTQMTALNGSLESNYYVNFEDSKINDKIDEFVSLGTLDIESLKTVLTNLDNYQTAYDNIKQVIGSNAEVAKQAAELNERILALKQSKTNYEKELKTLGYDVPSEVTLKNVSSIVLSTTSSGKIQMLNAAKNGTDEGKSWASDCKTFAKSILNVKTSLKSSIEKESECYRYASKYYRNKVNFTYAGIINVSGSISPWIGLAAGAVIGFLATSLICSGVYVSKVIKEENEAKAAINAEESDK